MAQCKGCGAPIVWTRNADTGAAMPIDPTPRPDGNIFLEPIRPGGAVRLVHVVSLINQPPDGAALFVSHHATCPKADEFRR